MKPCYVCGRDSGERASSSCPAGFHSLVVAAPAHVHAWSDWFCREYNVREFRICSRCGDTEERKVPVNLVITDNIIIKHAYFASETNRWT